MKPFEFVLVIISIITGLAFTEFANEVAFMIKHYETSVFSLPYLTIMCTGLMSGLNYWASIYAARNIMQWDNFKMGLLFFTSLTYYVMARVFLTVESSSFDGNYIELYHKVIGTSLALMICWVALLIIEARVLKKGKTLKWYVPMILFALLMGSGVVIQNRAYREILAFILFGLQVVNIMANQNKIDDTVVSE